MKTLRKKQTGILILCAAESLGALPRRQGCQLLADILRGQQVVRKERLHEGGEQGGLRPGLSVFGEVGERPPDAAAGYFRRRGSLLLRITEASLKHFGDLLLGQRQDTDALAA